jgi:hypothetical protein
MPLLPWHDWCISSGKFSSQRNVPQDKRSNSGSCGDAEMKGQVMASANCPDKDFLLSLAESMGKKAFFLGLELTSNPYSFNTEESDAFLTGWLSAELEFGEPLPSQLPSGNCCRHFLN